MKRLWWHLRFFWCAFLGYEFEDTPVQQLVDEHWQRWGNRG